MPRTWPLLVLVVLVLVALHPLMTYGRAGDQPAADDQARVSRYDSVYEVDAQGDALVTETIEVEIGEGGQSQGLRRVFDEVDPYAKGARRVPEVSKVTRDGREQPFTWEDVAGGRLHVLSVGVQGSRVEPGTHTYVLQYSMEALFVTPEGGGEGAELHWDVLDGRWLQPVTRARATFRLPVVPDAVACTSSDESNECRVSGEKSSTVVVSASGLAAGTRLTVQAGLPDVAPSAQPAGWSARWSKVLGTQWWYVALVAAGILYAAWLGNRLGSRTFEQDPGAPLQYAPPTGVGPHQAVFVATAGTPPQLAAAALLHAAERGAVAISRDGEVWRVEARDLSVELDEVTAAFVAALGVGEGETFLLDPADAASRARVAEARSVAKSRVLAWALRTGHMDRVGPGTLPAFGVVAAFAAFVFCIWLGRPSTSLALIPGTYAALGLPLIYRGTGLTRSPSGRRLWAQAQGFGAALGSSASSESFDFAGREELHGQYLPWAVALGHEHEWDATFRAETGRDPAVPPYLTGLGASGVGGTGGPSPAEAVSGLMSAMAGESTARREDVGR